MCRKWWRKVHWSDESRFLLHVRDGRVRVWRQPNTAYAERNIVETLSYDFHLKFEPAVFFPVLKRVQTNYIFP
jgi:hypothetical protein